MRDKINWNFWVIIFFSLFSSRTWPESNQEFPQLYCAGVFKSAVRTQTLSLKLQLSWNPGLGRLQVKHIIPESNSAEFLKFALFPSPDPIETQNPMLAGVASLVDLSRSPRKVIFVPFSQVNQQTDTKAAHSESNELRLISNLSPVSSGVVGYFLATRVIELSLKSSKPWAKIFVEGTDFYDPKAVAMNAVSYVVVKQPTSAFDRYTIEMTCKEKKS